MLNTDLAVRVVLLFHFQVTECHKQGQSQAKSEQASFYLFVMFDEAEASKKTSTNCWIVTAGGLTHSFIRADLLKLLTCFLC